MTFAVGDYRAKELLAAGAAAQVWRGQRMATGQVVALKVFPPDQLAAVRREAALAAAVDHPHVVTVLDVVADEHRAALVTEYAAGGDLADLLARRGRLSPGQTLTVLIPLAAALATAHERQVVHGDISAGNIVFDQAGRPLLADLGAARAAMESGRPVQATPCDAAPELARAGAPTPASDMFSLGSVALACLTGRSAWPADDLRDVLIQAAAGQWPDLPDDAAPAPLVAAVRAMLEHDPDRRPGAASLVLDLRSAGKPEPLDLSEARRDGELPQSAAGAQGSPQADRFASHPRHGRDEDARPVASEPANQWWSTPEAPPGTGWAPPASGRPPLQAAARARALTKVRPDTAIGDPVPVAGGLRSWSARLRSRGSWAPSWRSRGTLRIAALAAAGVIVAVLAGLLGLRWAASGRADPVAAQQLSAVPVSDGRAGGSVATPRATTSVGASPSADQQPIHPAVPTSGALPRPSPTPARTPAPATPKATAPIATAAIATAPVAPATSTTAPPMANITATAEAADWTGTILALDRARSKALVSRNPALLDAVYTKDSPARSTDAQTIRTLLADGIRVSGAEHQVQSVQPETGSATTMLVRDSLPSYDVLDGAGSVIGRTPQRAAAPRLMVLVRTAAGYRISEVRSP